MTDPNSIIDNPPKGAKHDEGLEYLKKIFDSADTEESFKAQYQQQHDGANPTRAQVQLFNGYKALVESKDLEAQSLVKAEFKRNGKVQTRYRSTKKGMGGRFAKRQPPS